MEGAMMEPGLAERHQRLIDKYNKLYEMYSDLVETHSRCTARIQRANNMYNAAKDSARRWKNYLEKYGLIAMENPPAAKPEPSSRPSVNKMDSTRVTSSQTTEGDLDDVPSVNAILNDDDDDNEPEIISARTVKRRRRQAPATGHDLARIKLEPVSTSHPIMLGGPSSPIQPERKSPRKETSDLDAHLEPFRTPRKRKKSRPWSEEASRPPALRATISSLSEGDLRGLDGVKAETAETCDETHLASNSHPSHPSEDQAGHERALKPLSVNITASPHHTSGNRIQRKRKNSSSDKYRFLSEDGDQETSQVAFTTAKIQPEANSDTRLQALLSEGFSSERKPLPKRYAEQPRPLRRAKPATPPVSHQRSAAKPPSRHPKGPSRPPALETSPPPASPADEPLRSRPPGSLNLSDFKINPNYLGSTFAFADPIRGRDARRCLPGCTRPECCGNEFRKIVEIAGLPSKTDAEVLEAYLGPDFATLVGTYGPAERKEVLLQARTAAFANQFGKHRHAFERRSTPPGFWRTGMPTTQEEEADREAARKLERAKVEERWRDAMRGGGRWTFRDE